MFDETVEQEVYRGYEIRIVHDDLPMDPRSEWDNFGTMVCFHRRYSLGDEHDFSDVEEFEEFIEKMDGVQLPIYMYDHSGVTIRTYPFSCRWDSGQLGRIFATKDDIRREFGIKRVTKKHLERAEKILESEVRLYDQYVSGEVYSIIVHDPEGGVLDSLGGLFGDEGIKEGLKEARAVIDGEIKRRRDQWYAKLKKLIKNKVPLQNREQISFEGRWAMDM